MIVNNEKWKELTGVDISENIKAHNEQAVKEELKHMSDKEKPFMELSREQFDKTFDEVWDEAHKDGYNEGYISGLALAMAYIYCHVEDLAVSSGKYDIISKFNYAFEKAKAKIAAEKREA